MKCTDSVQGESILSLSVDELFRRAGLDYSGPISWGEDKASERGPGVYVVVIGDDSGKEVLSSDLPEAERQHWNPEQKILYIGRSKHLRRRLREFYRHKFGNKRPHAGGQAVIRLGCPLLVYCSAVSDYAGIERKLIEIFETEVGKRPYANRVRSAKLSMDNLTP